MHSAPSSTYLLRQAWITFNQAGVLLAHDAPSPGRDSLPRPAPSAPRYVSHHWLHGALGTYASPPTDLSDSSPAALDTCHLSPLAQEMPLELPRRVFDPVRHRQHRHAAGTNLMSRWTPGQECPPGAAARGTWGRRGPLDSSIPPTTTPAALLNHTRTHCPGLPWPRGQALLDHGIC